MGLITQFLTLAKLEAGDTDMPLERLNVNEACRENILDFYGTPFHKRLSVNSTYPDQALYANANKRCVTKNYVQFDFQCNCYGGDGKYLGMFLWA